MKISNLVNEEAMEALADILEPASEIMTDKEVVDLIRNHGKVMQLAQKILKNHSHATLEILAGMNRVPVEEYSCNMITLMQELLELLHDDLIVSFFRSQVQEMDVESSGSATENTEVHAE